MRSYLSNDETYDYGDYLLIRNGEVIAVSGNTEFYEYQCCPSCTLQYVDGDVVAKVVQVGQYISKEDNDE